MERMVNQEGRYYLRRGSVVRDAVEAVGGINVMVGWRGYSGIERRRADSTLEVYKRFRGRESAEQIVLEDGDVVFFGHEVF